MHYRLQRLEMLVGSEGLKRIQDCRVAVFGVGGVGSFAAEALARSGVGTIHLLDFDVVDVTNCNRQILALDSTVGRPKVDVMAARIKDINPECSVFAHNSFYSPDKRDELWPDVDYVLDCMDNVTAKIDVITTARARGVRCLSSMGAANKFDPTRIQATDISETKVDPLARVVRYELRKRGISTGVTVVWSDETPVVPTQPEPSNEGNDHPRRRQIPGSTAFVPPAAGLLLASLVVRDLLGRCGNR